MRRFHFLLVTLFGGASLLLSCATAVVPPILLESGFLEYPVSKKRAGIEEVVVVVYDISARGTVSNVRLVDENQRSEFSDAAIRYVRTWRFQPQKREGKPEPVYGVESRISFVIDSGEPTYSDYIR